MSDIVSAFGLLSWTTVLLTGFGTVLGIIVGAIPGLTATMAVAVLTSFTFGMKSMDAIAMLIGVFAGGVYGGSISALLLRVPGTSSAVMTSLDGYPMSQRGEAGKAIGISTISSFVGGMVSCLFLILACSYIATIAAKFGYAEYFVLAIFGLCVIASASANSLSKGLLAGGLGVLVSMVGMDSLTGMQRFTFGNIQFMSGINQVPALIGLFGVAEIINQMFHINKNEQTKQKVRKILPKLSEMWELKSTWLRSSLIGTAIGAMPGAGGPIAAYVAYNAEKNSSKNPEKFGTGIPQGIAAPECANNATVGGALIPMLALGVPGDGVTAIMMSAFAIHGLHLGPAIFATQAQIVHGVYIYTIIANLFMVTMGIFLARFFARIVNVDKKILLPLILVAAVIGSFAKSNKIFDVYVMIAFGVIGYLFDKIGISSSSFILGMVLGNLLETNLRQAMILSRGSMSIFFTRPICIVFWVLTILMVGIPQIKTLISKKKKQAG